MQRAFGIIIRKSRSPRSQVKRLKDITCSFIQRASKHQLVEAQWRCNTSYRMMGALSKRGMNQQEGHILQRVEAYICKPPYRVSRMLEGTFLFINYIIWFKVFHYLALN